MICHDGLGIKQPVLGDISVHPGTTAFTGARIVICEEYRLAALWIFEQAQVAVGVNEAIAENMAMMSRIRTPLIATVTGEANSGGAIAIGVRENRH